IRRLEEAPGDGLVSVEVGGGQLRELRLQTRAIDGKVTHQGRLRAESCQRHYRQHLESFRNGYDGNDYPCEGQLVPERVRKVTIIRASYPSRDGFEIRKCP